MQSHKVLINYSLFKLIFILHCVMNTAMDTNTSLRSCPFSAFRFHPSHHWKCHCWSHSFLLRNMFITDILDFGSQLCLSLTRTNDWRLWKSYSRRLAIKSGSRPKKNLSWSNNSFSLNGTDQCTTVSLLKTNDIPKAIKLGVNENRHTELGKAKKKHQKNLVHLLSKNILA